ncbi:hypothetical protein L1049_020803 [Liquidambar formosana]|uniref:Uncharacterized protein n=1 Tax=Liquidambar formosana TaxID=63359 RepID=A0AAP0XA61_LIQFO
MEFHEENIASVAPTIWEISGASRYGRYQKSAPPKSHIPHPSTMKTSVFHIHNYIINKYMNPPHIWKEHICVCIDISFQTVICCSQVSTTEHFDMKHHSYNNP